MIRAVLKILVTVAVFALCACSQVRTVVEVRERYVHDTLQVVDSVYRDRVQHVKIEGDTVYKTDSVFLFKYKTLERVKIEQVQDSIPYEVVVEKPVRIRNGYDRFTSGGFWTLLSLLVLWIAWRMVKVYFLRK